MDHSDLVNADLGEMFEAPGSFGVLKALAPGAYESVRDNLGLRGYGDLARYLWAERMFDRRYGVRTEYLVPPAELGFADVDAQAGASRYRATPPFCVTVSLLRLSERLGGLNGHGLVDYGCGAGRVLILGAEAGFGRAVGLELSPPLVAQARDNLERYAAGGGKVCDFDVMDADATRYVPSADMDVFYFFNPFSPEFFERALDGIRASVRAHPRVVYVLLFQTFRYTVPSLDMIGSVTGVQTYTNGLRPEAFVG